MLLGMAVNLAPPTGVARACLHGVLIASTSGVLALLGWPLLQATIEEARHRRISIELLFLAGLGGALGASLWSTFTGVGAVYYEVVGVLLTVYAVGKTLGAQSRARALAESQVLRRTFETCQQIGPDGSAIARPVAAIQPGDMVRVLAGEPIPIDGRIEVGQAFVCETPLTGEPFPVVRRAGDLVFAGSYAEDGELTITASVSGTQRRLDALLGALDAARERPCRMQAQADRIVRWFLPLVLGISAATFLFWSWKTSLGAGLYNALSVLLVACPCAMGLATPAALWSGLAALASRGLAMRSGDGLERLAAVNLMVFDKTGTLSEERHSLIDLATVGSAADRQAIAAQLCAVQSACAHPVARAFHSLASPQENPFHVRELKTVPALGVEAWIESRGEAGHHLRVGRRELIAHREGEDALLAQLRRASSEHLVYVEIDGQLRAIAAINERLRDSALDTLRALEQQGIACQIMTGDQPGSAGQLLGARAIHSGLTPLAKAAQVSQLAESGQRVGFVGDGVNDAPALRAASIGIALAHGAGVTTAGADAVLFGGDLRTLPWAVALCRQVRASIRSNLRFATAYNLIGIVLAATGLLHPVVAAVLMAVSSFTVAWRALRSTECGFACGVAATSPGQPSAISAPPAQLLTAPSFGQWLSTKLRSWTEANTPRQISQANKTAGLLVAAQIPFLIYLGNVTGWAAVLTATSLLALAVFIGRFPATSPTNETASHLLRMTIAMLGWGNWGMLLGWWADGGFGPLHACCVSSAGLGFDFWGFTDMPWMNAGMLILGLPPMLRGPAKSFRGVGRFGYGLLASAGMVWGMSYGAHVFMKWLGPWIAQPFLLAFAGMTAGMLLGMFLACEFARAIALAVRTRALPKSTRTSSR